VIYRQPAGLAIADGVAVDAASLSLPWSDPAVQWGVGVFETVAVSDGAPRHVEAHLALLDQSAAELAVALPERARLLRAVSDVAAGIATGFGWLKVLASRSGRWVVFGGVSDPSLAGRAVSAIVLPWRRHRLDPAAGLKSLAYLASVRGLEEAQRRGADEGLWLNDRGHVVDGCTANVFVVRGRAAVTPAPSDGARAGVTRARAIEALRAFGLQVREAKLRVLALRSADEIFLTSSVGGVRAVVRLDGRDVRRGTEGPVTRRLAGALASENERADPVAGGRDTRG
jgi:branched-chain amino acid aminotransferase